MHRFLGVPLAHRARSGTTASAGRRHPDPIRSAEHPTRHPRAQHWGPHVRLPGVWGTRTSWKQGSGLPVMALAEQDGMPDPSAQQVDIKDPKITSERPIPPRSQATPIAGMCTASATSTWSAAAE